MAGLALKGVMKLFENENELSDKLIHPLVKDIPSRDKRHQSQSHRSSRSHRGGSRDEGHQSQRRHSPRSHRASSRDDGHQSQRHHSPRAYRASPRDNGHQSHRRHHSRHHSREHSPPENPRRRSYHDHEPPPEHGDGYSSRRARSQDRDYTRAAPPPRIDPPPPHHQYQPPEPMKPPAVDHNYVPYDGMYGYGGPRARNDADHRFAEPSTPRRDDSRNDPRLTGPSPPPPSRYSPPMIARGGMQVERGDVLLNGPRSSQEMVPPGW